MNKFPYILLFAYLLLGNALYFLFFPSLQQTSFPWFEIIFFIGGGIIVYWIYKENIKKPEIR